MKRVVISGAGVAGASVGMHLAKTMGGKCEVILVDPRPPMTGTSQYSSECYRNFFMDPAAVPLMERSIEIIEDIDSRHNISMNRKGYVFLSGTREGTEALLNIAGHSSKYGAGEVRWHEKSNTYIKSPVKGLTDTQGNTFEGFDVVQGNEEIQRIFPNVSNEAKCMLHCRKAGWLDAQGLGSAYLREARQHGMQTILGGIKEIDTSGGSVRRVLVHNKQRNTSEWVQCDAFVNASGAWTQHINSQLGAPTLDLKTEIIAKVILNDVHNIVPQQETPFMVWRDPVTIDWGAEMSEALAELDDTPEGGWNNCKTWIDEQPGGQHLRPLGNNRVLLMWEHVHRHIDIDENPEFPISDVNEFYPQLALKGCQKIMPGLSIYDDALGKDTTVDAGYYSSTSDGRPIVGQHGPSNAFVLGGLSGWGIMSSAACGELLAQTIAGSVPLPAYHTAFTVPRVDPLRGPVVSLLDPPVEVENIVGVCREPERIKMTAI